MVIKRKYLLVFIVFLIILSFTGVYEDDEFSGEYYFFIKHKPCLKWYFYSPIGLTDRKLDDLTFSEQKQQIMYDEYVKKSIYRF